MSLWTNPWREELNALFLPLSLVRRPALRRSPGPDWLFATDLPSFASPGACEAFRRGAASLGWECGECAGWLHLRKPSSPPPGWFPREAEGEALCLRELLRRHPGTGDPTSAIILLMKAREEGAESWEKACRALHRDFARRLREKKELPRIQPD